MFIQEIAPATIIDTAKIIAQILPYAGATMHMLPSSSSNEQGIYPITLSNNRLFLRSGVTGI